MRSGRLPTPALSTENYTIPNCVILSGVKGPACASIHGVEDLVPTCHFVCRRAKGWGGLPTCNKRDRIRLSEGSFPLLATMARSGPPAFQLHLGDRHPAELVLVS
jgi:hypothetical protein